MNTLRPFILLSAAALLFSSRPAAAAEAGLYAPNDLLMFFRNPSGTAGTTDVAYFNLGSTYDVFRAAATPGSVAYGTAIPLGNIDNLLTATYGADWTGLSSTIFAGAQGQNGALNALATSTINGDYARTVYVTKPRRSAGTFQQANSSSPLYDPATTGVPTAIAGANNIIGMTQPGSVPNQDTTLDDQNQIVNGNPTTSYFAFQGGIIGSISGVTYSYGSIEDVVLGLDLFRVTKTTGTGTTNASIWQTANNITNPLYVASYPGGSARADYLGTIVLTTDGDVFFVGVSDEPPVTDDYTVWTQGYPGANLTDKEGDYDNDGFKNVAEYAFGTDPTVGNRALSSATVLSNNLSVGFFRRSTTNSEAPAYSVLSTTSLGSPFTNNAASISILTNSAPAGYQAASFTQPVAGSKFFYRIEATLPPAN